MMQYHYNSKSPPRVGRASRLWLFCVTSLVSFDVFFISKKNCYRIYNTKIAYSNILKILQPNKEIFQIKNSVFFFLFFFFFFHILAQNIDCGYLGIHNLCFLEK